MKQIALLVPDGDTSLSNLEATYKMFNMANDSLVRQGQPPLFKVRLVGLHKHARLSSGIFSVRPDAVMDEVGKADLIIIPAIHGNYSEVVNKNREFIPWIVRQYNAGAEVASLCIGAFLLAATGLLRGKSCATHWLAASEFRQMFPEVNLIDDKILTDEDGLYTSGGAYSSLNLNLYLVEKYAGRDFAVLSSKIFEIDINRNSQSPFIIFKGQKSHQDEEILKVQEYIEQNVQERFTVDDLCGRVAVTRRTFERRFKKATSNTAVEYIQRVKVEAAKKAFEKGAKSVNEVMFDVGYTDPKAFREVFKKITYLTPVAYLEKYQQPIGTYAQ